MRYPNPFVPAGNLMIWAIPPLSAGIPKDDGVPKPVPVCVASPGPSEYCNAWPTDADKSPLSKSHCPAGWANSGIASNIAGSAIPNAEVILPIFFMGLWVVRVEHWSFARTIFLEHFLRGGVSVGRRG